MKNKILELGKGKYKHLCVTIIIFYVWVTIRKQEWIMKEFSKLSLILSFN